MNLQDLTKRYNKSVLSAEQKLLAGFTELIGATSVEFEGGEDYNDEDYYDNLFDLKIDGESVKRDFETVAGIYKILTGHDTEFKRDSEYPEDSAYDVWEEVKNYLKNQMPAFI